MTGDVVGGEIENWVAWCWAGEDPAPGSPSRCYSAEGRYDPPATDETQRQPKRQINHYNAQRVQAVFDRMDQLTRQILRYEYTQRELYDQWERGTEVGADGEVQHVWVRVGNTRRQMARLRLKVSRDEYMWHVDAFKAFVKEEFSSEVRA